MRPGCGGEGRPGAAGGDRSDLPDRAGPRLAGGEGPLQTGGLLGSGQPPGGECEASSVGVSAGAGSSQGAREVTNFTKITARSCLWRPQPVEKLQQAAGSAAEP